MNRKYIQVIQDLSTMTPVKETGVGEAVQMQERLQKGKQEFQEAMNKVLGAVIRMSAMDLALGENAGKLGEISEQLFRAAANIKEIAQVTNGNANEVSIAHERLTSTISSVAGSSEEILKGMEQNSVHLNEVVDISNQTIENSREMKEDMDNLLNVLENMNQVIAAINRISAQTNLLSLNASIEAARAGEAGRGFAIVAQQISMLADETKGLTANMDEFVAAIQEASRQSSQSCDMTVDSLQGINQKLQEVITDNCENQEKIGEIVDSINNTAALSQEIHSAVVEVEEHVGSLNEDCSLLNQDADTLKQVTESVKEIIRPIVEIEGELDAGSKIMGTMAEDAFYALDNQMFSNMVKSAILAHQKWMQTVEQIVTEGQVVPLQTNPKKCGFGHFYYAVTPQNESVHTLWKSLEEKHSKLHGIGKEIIQAVWDENEGAAEAGLETAKEVSKELFADFDRILSSMEVLEKSGQNVFLR